MKRLFNQLHQEGVDVALKGDRIVLVGLKKVSRKKAKNIIKLARNNKLQLKIELKACAKCQHKRTCEHDLVSTISFFQSEFLNYHIVPMNGLYIVDGLERYIAERCELEILRELWSSCPTRCRYCHYASKDKSGDWWCSRPAPGEEGRLIFRNLALLKGCPKGASSFRNKNRQRKLGVR